MNETIFSDGHVIEEHYESQPRYLTDTDFGIEEHVDEYEIDIEVKRGGSDSFHGTFKTANDEYPLFESDIHALAALFTRAAAAIEKDRAKTHAWWDGLKARRRAG